MTYTSKQILETYLNSLINQNYIDKAESELDRRANMYYPAGLTSSAMAAATEQSTEQQIPKYIK